MSEKGVTVAASGGVEHLLLTVGTQAVTMVYTRTRKFLDFSCE